LKKVTFFLIESTEEKLRVVEKVEEKFGKTNRFKKFRNIVYPHFLD